MASRTAGTTRFSTSQSFLLVRPGVLVELSFRELSWRRGGVRRWRRRGREMSLIPVLNLV